jgi:hypothetical protein
MLSMKFFIWNDQFGKLSCALSQARSSLRLKSSMVSGALSYETAGAGA